MRSIASFLRDLRQAVRRLLREKGFTVTALSTLAVCLAANVAIFTVVHSVLLRPLPFPDAGRLVVVYNAYPKASVQRAGASHVNFHERRGQIPAFEEIALVRTTDVIIGEAGSPDRASLGQATPSFFPVLGVQPAIGRLFHEDENTYGNNNVVVLTDAFWRSHYNADPAVLGTVMRVNEEPNTIVGVLPPGFRYLSSEAEIWKTRPSNEEERSPNNRHANNQDMIARLKPGATLAEAQAQLDALNARLATTDPFAAMVADAGFCTRVEDLHAEHVSSIRPTLVWLQLGVLFLLVIGIVNLVNLLLVRATARSKDLAVRQVLGASRGRIAAQVMAETVVLALAGGVLGLGLGAAAVKALSWLGMDRLPLGASISLDPAAAGVALAGSVAVGLLLALPVVWYNLHGQLAPLLNSESRSGTTTRAHHRLRHTLLVAQIALAFVLLAGAGLLGLSFKRVLAVDPGFQADNLLTGRLGLPWTNYREDEPRVTFAERVLAGIRALPGVTSVSLATSVPFAGNFSRNATWVEGHTPAPGESLRAHSVYLTAGDFFQTIGIPLFEGRLLTDADCRSDPFVCVVDREFAHHYWPDGSALGHRVFPGPPELPEVKPATIVGVVGNIKESDLAGDDAPGTIYYPFRPDNAPLGMFVAVRTTQSPESAGPALRRAVLQVDAGLPLDDILTMRIRMDNSLTPRRSPMMLAGVFSGVALLLAAIGIYGVLAYAVGQRRREIGVRMALGARPDQILAQFLSLGAKLLAIGTLLGLGGAWLVGRTMQGLLFGVTAMHAGVLVGTAVVIVAAGVLASYLPSRRAARVHPLEALRAD